MTDYWRKFLESGSVYDYLAYRESLSEPCRGKEKDERYVESVRRGGEADADRRER